MVSRVSRRGFSLAELLLSMMLITIVILTVVGLSTSIFRVNQEGADTTAGVAVGEAELQRVINLAQEDTNFWDLDHTAPPYSTTTVVANGTEYKCVIRAVTVQQDGMDLGSAGGLVENRLKKVDLTVTWWNSDTDKRQGYGELQVKLSRLISEVN